MAATGPLTLRRSYTLIGAVAVGALVLTGCTPESRAGVAAAADGRPVLVAALCGSERVEEVELRTAPLADVEDAVPDDVGDPEVLWRITSVGGEHVERFVVGEAPAGFVTEVPAPELLPNGAMTLGFDSTGLGESVTFTLEELAVLREGELVYLGDLADYDDLRDAADDGGRCGNDVLGDVARFGILAGASLAVLIGAALLIAWATGGFDRRKRTQYKV